MLGTLKPSPVYTHYIEWQYFSFTHKTAQHFIMLEKKFCYTGLSYFHIPESVRSNFFFNFLLIEPLKHF